MRLTYAYNVRMYVSFKNNVYARAVNSYDGWMRAWMFAGDDNMTSQGPHNVTSLVDTSVTLRCPLERGSSRTTAASWQKRDRDGDGWQPLPRDGDRVRVGPGDDDELEFDRVLASDAGFYRCSRTAARGVDTHSTPVVLIVHGELQTCFYVDLLGQSVQGSVV